METHLQLLTSYAMFLVLQSVPEWHVANDVLACTHFEHSCECLASELSQC